LYGRTQGYYNPWLNTYGYRYYYGYP
jgi:hypothetical protein